MKLPTIDKTLPLVKEIPAEAVREFSVVGISGDSALAVIIQEKDGEFVPNIVTGSPFSHVAIAVYAGTELMWFEFTAGGGQFSPLEKYLKGKLVLLEADHRFSVENYIGMKIKVFELEGKRYDYTGLLGKLLHIWVFLRKRWKKNVLSGAGYFCSAGVELILRAGGLSVSPYKDVKLNEPKDIYMSDKMRRVL